MIVPIDFKAEIVRIVHWKQIAADHDMHQSLPWFLPKVGAKSESITQAEDAIGASFSDEYRGFLSLANGWRGFYVTTDLFGTDEFLSGRAHLVRKQIEVRSYAEDIGIHLGDLIPIGASEAALDLFLLVSSASRVEPGKVLWWAGEEIERYPSFGAFFAAMVNYNAQIAERLVRKTRK